MAVFLIDPKAKFPGKRGASDNVACGIAGYRGKSGVDFKVYAVREPVDVEGVETGFKGLGEFLLAYPQGLFGPLQFMGVV